MYPIADLTAFCRRTSGDVPPKLVGASTTVVGSKMYLYGGRLVAERKMVSDIYMFDLETLKWEKIPQSQDDDVPQARYFHSADTWNNFLIIFGGMAIQLQSDNPEDLCVLNDVRLFDLGTRRWLPDLEYSPSSPIPKARYAHLSSITADRLFVIGGQDLNNVWLDDVHVYDLKRNDWVLRRDYPRHCGTYRSVAVTANKRVRLPQEDQRSSQLGAAGTRFSTDANAPPTPDATQSESLIHLPYSTEPTDDYPCDILLFSNYNFTDVQRELEVFSPLPGSDYVVSDRSTSMTGTFFPPGLRFPTGAILGSHFIVAGTYLSQSFQSFSIWALDLVSMTWTRVDPGSALSGTSGSWFRSCLWPEANKYLVFGNRHGNLVEDYNRRLLSWDHVIVIDLEAFGIYSPPPLVIDIPQQELGLAALEEGILADFEIICDDGRKIKCSRKLLEDRWPWFKKQRQLFLQAATRAMESVLPSASSTPLPDVRAASDKDEPRPDPRLTPRGFNLSEPYPITLAFLQYLYSMALITPLQHAPAVLSQLLLISSTYELPHLQTLVKHAMHRALTFATSVGIYGVSTLCNCRSLQIRALRVVMAYSQKRPNPSRNRSDKDGSGGGRNADANGSGGPGSGNFFAKGSAARPRGMSDASYMRSPSDVGTGMGGGTQFANGPDELGVLPEMAALRLDEFGPPSSLGHRSADSGSSMHTTTGIKPPTVIKTIQPTPVHAFGQRRLSPAIGPPPSPPEGLPPRPGTMSPAGSASPSPKIKAGGLRRTNSVVSMSTDKDIRAMADIIMSSVEEEEEEIATAPTQRFSVLGSQALHESLVELMAGQDNTSLRSRSSTSGASYLSSPSSEASLSPGSDVSADEYYDNAHLSPTYFSPPGRSRQRYLSDTPSMTTAESHSIHSLPTPPLSRTSSYQQLYSSPPMSPSTSMPSALDAGLGVIHERQSFEDEEHIRAQFHNYGTGFGHLAYDDIPVDPHMAPPHTAKRVASMPSLDRPMSSMSGAMNDMHNSPYNPAHNSMHTHSTHSSTHTVHDHPYGSQQTLQGTQQGSMHGHNMYQQPQQHQQQHNMRRTPPHSGMHTPTGSMQGQGQYESMQSPTSMHSYNSYESQQSPHSMHGHNSYDSQQPSHSMHSHNSYDSQQSPRSAPPGFHNPQFAQFNSPQGSQHNTHGSQHLHNPQYNPHTSQHSTYGPSKLLVRTDSPDTIMRQPRSATSSDTQSNASSSGALASRGSSSGSSGGKGLGRLFGGKKNGSNGSDSFTASNAAMDKLAKAEEKKRKKQEEKEKRERLAREFQNRAIAQKADNRSLGSNGSNGKKQRRYDEEGAMYDGLQNVAL